MEKPYLSLVIPFKNEEGNLEKLYSEIKQNLPSQPYEIILIDDGSTDFSLNIAKKLAAQDQNIKIISFRRNFGKSAGLSTGFSVAQGQFVITLDADLQDDPAEIPKLITKAEEGFDVVCGWKKNRHDNLIKNLSSKMFNWAVSAFIGPKLHDYNCGLKLYRHEALEDLNIYGDLYRFIPAFIHAKGFKVTEIEVNHRPRQHGQSKYGQFGLRRASRGFFDILTVLFIIKFTRRPLHLFGWAGVVSFLVGLGILIYLTIDKIFFNELIKDRVILNLGILLVLIGIQFISTGLIAELIVREQNQKQKKYPWKETVNL